MVKIMHTDVIMKNLWLHLARDFRSELGEQFLHGYDEIVQNIDRTKSDALKYRELVYPGVMQASPWLHKTVTQLATLHKRYIFATDKQPNVVANESMNGFIAFQSQINGLRMTMATHRVLREARKIVKQILGAYDPEEHAKCCQFGSRANRGVPLTDSYLDVKVARPSGSDRHLKWFIQHLNGDDILRQACKVKLPEGSVHAKCQPFEVFEDLALTAVPKSWKAGRIICPNSVIGAFHSYGLGLLIAKALRAAGLDISKLPVRHGHKARKASKNRKFVTTDLSKASDSFIYELVAWLCPRPWLRALKHGRIRHVSYKGRKIQLRSFMAMGIGYTFPLQTLLFYAIIKAIQNLLGLDYDISVYGDDLIYHRSIHDHVVTILGNLNFSVNTDKTFVHQSFRESCGQDFYRGVDVRPFQPEFVGCELKGRKLSAFLYKTVNGLTRRWDPVEIPRTYWYLQKLIIDCDGLIYQVPMSFPDYAGVKVSEPQTSWFHVPWSPVVWKQDIHPKTGKLVQGGVCQFRHLVEVPGDRKVLSLNAYYWSWHRNKAQESVENKLPWINLGLSLDELLSYGWRPDDDDRGSSAISWKKVSPKKVIRSSFTGRRYRKRVPVVPDKQIRSFKNKLQTLSAWF